MADEVGNVVPFPGWVPRKGVDAAEVVRAASVVVALCDGNLAHAVAMATSILTTAGNPAFAKAVVAKLRDLQTKANTAK